MPHALLSPFHGARLVIKHLTVKNFRGYKQLKLSNLKRINVIVGENGSGKTALLEALYLALGAHPELYFRLRQARSLGDRVSIPFTANDIFFDPKSPAILAAVGTPGITRTTRIYYDATAPITIPLDQQVQDTATAPPLAFSWKKGNKIRTLHVVATKDGKIQVLGGPIDPISSSFFSGAAAIVPVETANRFQALDEHGNAKPVIEAMTNIFPMIEDLSIGSYASSPMMYARLKGQKGKIPLGLVSAGINKLMAILCAIFDHRGRAVFIDEIENGLYYGVMSEAWASLFKFSQKNHTQLFVSTHSMECLRALLPVLKKNEAHFCLLRTKYSNGESKIRQIEGTSFEKALEQGMEVR